MNELESLYQSGYLSNQVVHDRRTLSARPYQPPPLTALTALQSVPLFAAARHSQPEWVRFAAWNRQWCASAIFKIEEPSGPRCWKFVFAKQSPIFACVVLVVPVAAPGALLGEVPLHEVADSAWEYAFREGWSRFAFSDDGVWKPEWPCSILPGVCYASGRMLVGDGPWLPLREAMSLFPKLPEGEVAGQTGSEDNDQEAATFDGDVFNRNPWRADDLKWGGAMTRLA